MKLLEKRSPPYFAALLISFVAYSDAKELVLEEVLVTAQKRVQEAMTVPVTVDSFSAQKIDTTGALVLADIDDYIPGFEADGSNVTQSALTLRGIKSSHISTGGDPSVATFYDEVYLPPAAITIAFSDMARVEVLKGPQGTLFGRNAVAGVINMIPNRPDVNFESSVNAKVANYNTQRLEGMINLPIADHFFLRANMLSNQRGGLAGNVGPSARDPGEQDNIAARVALLWELSDQSEFQIAYDYDKVDNAPPHAIGVSEFAYSLDPYAGKVENDVINGEETREMHAITAKLIHSINDAVSAKLICSSLSTQIIESKHCGILCLRFLN